MPREIADSDDESDIIPPPKLNKIDMEQGVGTPGSTRDLDQSDPVFNTTFDDFLSPTQRLSSYDSSHDNTNGIDTSKLLNSSTNRFLEALAPSSDPLSQHTPGADSANRTADPGMSGKRSKETASATGKRSWTEIEQSEAPIKNSGSTKKKAKHTRGSSATQNLKSRDALDFEAVMYDSNENSTPDGDVVVNPPDMVSIDARTDYTSPLDLSLHLSSADGGQSASDDQSIAAHSAPTRGHVPYQPYTPHGDFFGANLGQGTTSNSSMGNYQSFSINPNRLGMDFDKINPFGSLSQVSLPGDLDSEETRGIADIFRNSASFSTRTSMTNGTETNNSMVNGIENDMQTSPIKGGGTKRTSKNRKTDRDEAHCSPPFSPITNPDDQNTIDEKTTSRRRDRESSAVVELPEVKAAPKKRGRKPKNQKPIEPSEPEHTSINNLEVEEQSINRTTRAGTVDSVSNVSEISQGTNTGRKRKTKKSDMAPPDLQSKKLPSSDLGLDNKAVIGLSPERYVPRPSKRRGRVDTHVLDLSEANGGTVEEETDPTEEAASKLVATKGKRGRKSKAKGSQKSAATIITLDDDDDEDVVETTRQEAEEVTDAKSVAVEDSDLPKAEFGSDQKSSIEAIGNEDDEDDVVTRSGNRRAKISVDIPVLSKPEGLSAQVTEPKKRGRKRKKVVEDAPAENKDNETQRPVLGERDPNIQVEKKKTVELCMEIDPDSKEEANGDSETKKIHEEKEQKHPPPKEAVTTATPIKKTSTPSRSLSSTPMFNARGRVGLSKRHSIPSLLRKVDRNKEAPKAIERKEKVNKRVLEEREQERIAREEAEAEGRDYKPLDQLRDKDGRLVEWDF